MCIALFEASNWIHSLSERIGLKGDFDPDVGVWRWYPERNLPLPSDDQYANEGLI
jgi:hypothetical protein